MTGHIVGLGAGGREPEPQERQRPAQLLDENPLPRDQLGASLRLDRPAAAGRTVTTAISSSLRPMTRRNSLSMAYQKTKPWKKAVIQRAQAPRWRLDGREL